MHLFLRANFLARSLLSADLGLFAYFITIFVMLSSSKEIENVCDVLFRL